MRYLSFAFLVASTLSLGATAAEVTAVGKGRACVDYFFGQMHIQGLEAQKKAEELAKANASFKLDRECKEKKGTLTLSTNDATCGKYEDQGMHRGFFSHSVCVSCEATAKGDCK